MILIYVLPRGYMLPLVIAAFMSAMIGGCAQEPIVHDGKCHPAQCRYGKDRPAGPIPNIIHHVIAVDGQGVARMPDSKFAVYKIDQFRNQIAGIFHAMDAYHQGRPKEEKRRIMIFVHGGLNPLGESLSKADNEIEPIMDEGYYPIFLNWNSNLGDAYLEHLTRISQGQTDTALVRKLLAPAYLFADLARAVTRAPVVWSNEIGTDLAAAHGDFRTAKANGAAPDPRTETAPRGLVRWANAREGKEINRIYEELQRAQDEDEVRPIRTAVRVYQGANRDTDGAHLAGVAVRYVLTLGTKIVLAPVIDFLGTPAWENMTRRTLIAFDGQAGGNPRDPDFQAKPGIRPASAVRHETVQSSQRPIGGVARELRKDRAQNFDTTGAMEVFREQFLKVVEDARKNKHPYEITLVGHSMGTMVLNEWLRRDVSDSRETDYANIVFMAAACSVRDFRRSVVPYMLLHGTTQFYNLTLHPLADLRERERGFDLPPRGSLLVWLDDFLDSPKTPLDRTMGRWDNIIPAARSIPEKVAGRVFIRAFALAPSDDDGPPKRGPDYGPQAHGQFRGRPYWLREFWYAKSNEIPKLPICAHASK